MKEGTQSALQGPLLALRAADSPLPLLPPPPHTTLRLQVCCQPDRGGALLPRLLRAAVALLEEGRLEARTAGKRMLWELRRQLDSGRGPGADDFRRTLARLDCSTNKVGVWGCW